jgi:protease I
MARLTGRNILLIIPKDYFDERQLEPLLEIFEKEDAIVNVASSKLKEAVGMRSGKITPDLLLVDCMEGLTGDSYVTEAGHGTRQVKGIFHGVVIIGGQGARKYLWEDKILHLLVSDRHKSGFLVGAIGSAVPCLAIVGLLEGIRATYEKSKHADPIIEKHSVIIGDDKVVVAKSGLNTDHNTPIITAVGHEAIKEFAEAFIEEIQKTREKP